MLDDDTWHDLVTRSVELARERGALGVLPLALSNLAFVRIFAGELDAATPLLEEADAIADATDADRITFGWLILAAFRGDESALAEHVEADKAKAIARGEGLLPTVGQHASALMHNGLGRYDAALTAAEAASGPDAPMTTTVVVAGARRGGQPLQADRSRWRSTRSSVSPSERRQLGPNGRSASKLARAPSLSEGCVGRGALSRGDRPARPLPHRTGTRPRPPALRRMASPRRQTRRCPRAATHGTRHAHGFGMDGFAERARRELIATGEKATQTPGRESGAS